jgi:hypothetical protein
MRPGQQARDRRRYSRSGGFILVLGSIGVMGFSLAVFLGLTAIETAVGYHTDPPALMFVPLLALPAVAFGSIVSWRTQLVWPFFLGALVSLLPIVLAFLLPEALDPTFGSGGAD